MWKRGFCLDTYMFSQSKFQSFVADVGSSQIKGELSDGGHEDVGDSWFCGRPGRFVGEI